ncbi:MerR family transcriptional regulator [Halalkalibacter sp. APA_J-10(15)]|uniref:MerR family transcriptional regulator n=1 Tax=unclassified Halalkalibacter TaxID=2893063 RepID=UPI001FF3D630|nr:MerR family transcriptional regulator [Halalkalibacter sp. APA_J-10(15)]MCK0470481.1 MerR family transcriptional regulator [Halalkalibacter sp. APA_J-10(15)]
MISIKEVVKQTGVTVRTLRHYDHIGLLKPAGKTEGGHRLYGVNEIKRLQQIQFLKTLRFTLQEIQDMLAGEQQDWYSSLQNQLTFVLEEKAKLNQMAQLLRGLMNEYTLEGKNDLLHIQKLIKMYEGVKDEQKTFLHESFNQNERELLDLLPNVNSGDPDTLEWISLLAQIKRHMSKGIGAIEVQRIIRRMEEKEKEQFGGDEAFAEKVWEIRRSEEQSKQAGFYPIEPEVLTFIEDATNYYLKQQKSLC